MQPRRLALYITPELHGCRVDSLLRRQLHLSTGAIRRAKYIPACITLDDEQVFTNALVNEGQTLSVQVGDSQNSSIPPQEGALDIYHEDEDLLIVSKAARLAVHPSPGRPDGTLGNHIMAHFQRSGLVADYHPVNRLDRGTSGLMSVAKHAHAHEQLRQILHTDHFLRQYLAICEGVFPKDCTLIDLPIGRADDSILRREVRPDGAAAKTHVELLGHDGKRSLLRLQLETGRTHQIRVHLSHLGFPLVGDFLYGQESDALPDRVALHACALSLLHPVSRQPLSFQSALPQELKALLTPPLSPSEALGGYL